MALRRIKVLSVSLLLLLPLSSSAVDYSTEMTVEFEDNKSIIHYKKNTPQADGSQFWVFWDLKSLVAAAALFLGLYNLYNTHQIRKQDNQKSLKDDFWFRKMIAEPLTDEFEIFFTKWRSEKGPADASFPAAEFVIDTRRIIDRAEALALFGADYPAKVVTIFDDFDDDVNVDYDAGLQKLNKSFYNVLFDIHNEINKHVMKN